MAVTEETTTPQFAHAVRGYDRFQVDEYIGRLNEWAAGAQARAEHAERRAATSEEEVRALHHRLNQLEAERPATPEAAVSAAAERVSGAVAAGLREIEQIRARAAQEADRLVADARQQAVELVESARQSMAAIGEAGAKERQEATVHARSMIDQATSKAADVRRQADDAAQQLLRDAKARAEEMIAAAEADAADRRRQSDDETRRQQEAINRLVAERQQIKQDLGRLRGAIHTLIAEPLDGHDAEGASGDQTAVIDLRAGAGQPQAAAPGRK
ncbi:hypothetical protein K6U06_18095 [Acidiferrimicrobium sp. IK]|uniref:hypothetical protein n=1 Tax=Acidiferrimicrobium sp. IK TaxID=2871700 RepID=UPI0021CAFE17|nr:hypothetical protein [Acidiferrimicrobium sp. IK]MCU4186283.1 hypothetical protein [Acidiferrimicrobium sp. IK]